MADQIFSVEGVEGIVNPTRWNAQNTPYGEGAWNTGGFTAQDVIQGGSLKAICDNGQSHIIYCNDSATEQDFEECMGCQQYPCFPYGELATGHTVCYENGE